MTTPSKRYKLAKRKVEKIPIPFYLKFKTKAEAMRAAAKRDRDIMLSIDIINKVIVAKKVSKQDLYDALWGIHNNISKYE